VSQDLEIVARDENLCGEGPIWDAARRRLIWTDISSNLVYALVPASGEKRIISRDLMVSGIALNRTGDLVFIGSDGLFLWRENGLNRPLLADPTDQPLCFNDFIADLKGRLYAGTYYWGPAGMQKHGSLYLIEPTGAMRCMDEGIELSNGLGFSPGNRLLYYADSAARAIYAYDVDAETGALSCRRVFVRVPAEEGIPDGLTVDSDGYIWCALWYGAQVVRYDPDGAVERRIDLPVKQVSSVALGGDDLTDLFITTAGESWPSDLAPPGYDFRNSNMGGSLYRIRVETPGKPEHQANFTWL
jgi:sugar lactone lactonase YvrE